MDVHTLLVSIRNPFLLLGFDFRGLYFNVHTWFPRGFLIHAAIVIYETYYGLIYVKNTKNKN